MIISHVFSSFAARRDVLFSFCGPRALLSSTCGPRIYLSLRLLILNVKECPETHFLSQSLLAVISPSISTSQLSSSIISRPGVNFTNVLRAAFTYVSCARSFLCLRFRFLLYWRKTVGTKAVHIMLMKLTPGVNFTNILRDYLPNLFEPKMFKP
jgi:hypothetical protein